MQIIEVDEGGAEQAHPAVPGDQVVIRLPESPTSGFRWHLDTYDAAVLEATGEQFLAATDAMTGGGGTREFRFLVQDVQRSEIALSLRRAWEADVAATARFSTTVN
jgi:inhibitor of cysteine peptidase